MITPCQIRAARALLNWSQTDLAIHSGLTPPTIANIELGKQTPSSTTLQKIYEALEISGIEFLEDDGVKKKSGKIYNFKGRDGFQKFYQDIDSTAQLLRHGEFLVCNVNERDFMKWIDEETIYKHYSCINRTSITYRILIVEGDDYMPAKNFTADYKWTPSDQFYSVPFYVYGSKVAYIGFEENDVNVFVVDNDPLAQLCRRQFSEMWERAISPSVTPIKSYIPPSQTPPPQKRAKKGKDLK